MFSAFQHAGLRDLLGERGNIEPELNSCELLMLLKDANLFLKNKQEALRSIHLGSVTLGVVGALCCFILFKHLFSVII